MSIARRFLSTFILFLLAFNTDASPTNSVKTVFYSIYPQNQYDILRELNYRSPVRSNAMVFHGNTDWNVSWRFQLQPVPGGCKLTSIKTHVDITYTLPALDGRVKDKETRKRFNAFSEALTRHEHNHGKNGLKAAKDIDDGLHNLRPAGNCRQLEQEANALGHRIVKQYSEADSEYDRVTQNGRTEGAFIN